MIRIGTRGSPLAQYQANLVLQKLQDLGHEAKLHIVKTTGDIITNKPLYDIGGKALFVKEIQELLLDEEIDIAVHSLKDCEVDTHKSLHIAAVLKRDDPRDIMIRRENVDLNNAFTLGTSSPRRHAMCLAAYEKVHVVNLRGNIQTRLEKLTKGECDATILAKAGLDRMRMLDQNQIRGFPRLSVDILDFVPAVAQGTIGIECKKGSRILPQLMRINHKETFNCARIERYVISKFNGNCKTAIGVFCTFISENTFSLVIHYGGDNLVMRDKIYLKLSFDQPWQETVDAAIKKLKGGEE